MPGTVDVRQTGANRSRRGDALQALVFNIKRCSFEDGPGIRTAVFLKGCPLRCTWCCNPEGQETHPELSELRRSREFFEKYMSIEELFAIIEKDLLFYRTSGGGVTFAGGEPTMHYRFVDGLVRKCREFSIHTSLIQFECPTKRTSAGSRECSRATD